jgi:hypothetical protein
MYGGVVPGTGALSQNTTSDAAWCARSCCKKETEVSGCCRLRAAGLRPRPFRHRPRRRSWPSRHSGGWSSPPAPGCREHPLPVGQVNACLVRGPLHGRLERHLLRRCQGGGDPPGCAKASAAGPSRRNTVSQLPAVCGLRPGAAATRAVDQPWSASHSACHRSRLRGGGARYMRCHGRTASAVCRDFSLLHGFLQVPPWLCFRSER